MAADAWCSRLWPISVLAMQQKGVDCHCNLRRHRRHKIEPIESGPSICQASFPLPECSGMISCRRGFGCFKAQQGLATWSEYESSSHSFGRCLFDTGFHANSHMTGLSGDCLWQTTPTYTLPWYPPTLFPQAPQHLYTYTSGVPTAPASAFSFSTILFAQKLLCLTLLGPVVPSAPIALPSTRVDSRCKLFKVSRAVDLFLFICQIFGAKRLIEFGQ